MAENIGINIKTLRQDQQMTLKDLANKTEFSISFLSQLERGKSSATLESLKKISMALGVNPGYFFNNSFGEDTLETEHMKKNDIHYQSLHSTIENPAFSPHLVVLAPYQNKGNLIKHPGQEFLYVLEGELTVQIDDKIYTLEPFESIMFDSSKEHYWFNYTDEDIKFLCINYDY